MRIWNRISDEATFKSKLIESIWNQEKSSINVMLKIDPPVFSK